MYDYKTFLVNNPDMKGDGIAKTKEMFKSANFNNGCTYWHFKYDKYGDEGQVRYKFANFLAGFMQRCDPKMSPVAFGRVVMLGSEPNLDIEAVWLFRGTEIPAIFKEHPQVEYF
jgi:elongation factor 1-gamma